MGLHCRASLLLPSLLSIFGILVEGYLCLFSLRAGRQDEAGGATVDGAKAGDILRSLASLRQQRGQRKENAALEADVEAVVGMLTGNVGHGHGHGPAGQVRMRAPPLPHRKKNTRRTGPDMTAIIYQHV